MSLLDYILESLRTLKMLHTSICVLSFFLFLFFCEGSFFQCLYNSMLMIGFLCYKDTYSDWGDNIFVISISSWDKWIIQKHVVYFFCGGVSELMALSACRSLKSAVWSSFLSSDLARFVSCRVVGVCCYPWRR
jgi:hypothetical protein